MSLLEAGDASALPCPTIEMAKVAYKLKAIVTNRRTMEVAELIWWHYERCGKSEEAHAIMKEDFTGGGASLRNSLARTPHGGR